MGELTKPLLAVKLIDGQLTEPSWTILTSLFVSLEKVNEVTAARI